MSDGKTKAETGRPADASAKGFPSEGGEDHLATIRVQPSALAGPLPPMPRPPPSGRGSIAPPPTPSSALSKDVDAAPSSGRAEVVESRPSWLHSVVGPPGNAQQLNQRRLGAVCVVSAVVLFVIALVLGLSSPPSESVLSPTVLGAVVIARALLALGVLATGLTLFRVGIRVLAAGLGSVTSSAANR